MRRLIRSEWFSSGLCEIGVRSLAFLVFAAVIPFGSVMPLPFFIISTAVLILALVSGLLLEEPETTRGLFRGTLVLAGLLGTLIGFQSINLGAFGIENPVWAEARALLNFKAGYLSIAPADTLPALLWLLLPVVVFLLGLLYCAGGERAKTMLAFLGAGSGAIAVFALFQFKLYPTTLIVVEKKAYLDSLTGVFVNRNTAATFFGLSLLINLSRIRDGLPALMSLRKPAGLLDQINMLMTVVFAVAAALALMLTRSRAGIACSGVAMLIYFPFVVQDWAKQSLVPRNPRVRPLAFGVGALLLVIVGFITFAGQAILRMEQRGVVEDDRFCILPGIGDAAAEQWLMGYGFGTFRFAFAPFRDAACGIFGIFDRAHNGYLEAMMGLGIMAPLAILAGVLALTLTFLTGFRNRRRNRHYAVLGFAGLTLVVLHTAVDFSVQIPGFAVFFAAFLAPVVSICKLQTRRREQNSAIQILRADTRSPLV